MERIPSKCICSSVSQGINSCTCVTYSSWASTQLLLVFHYQRVPCLYELSLEKLVSSLLSALPHKVGMFTYLFRAVISRYYFIVRTYRCLCEGETHEPACHATHPRVPVQQKLPGSCPDTMCVRPGRPPHIFWCLHSAQSVRTHVLATYPASDFCDLKRTYSLPTYVVVQC